jgi:hypothetical protein
MLCYSTTLLDFSRPLLLAISILIQGVGTSIVGKHIYIPHLRLPTHTYERISTSFFFIKVSQVSSFFFLNLLFAFSIWLLVAGVGVGVGCW